MQNLSSLLVRFAKSLGQDTVSKESVISCVRESLHFELEPQQVNVKGDTLEISTSAIKKNEIKLHEEKLLAEINLRGNLRLKRIFYKSS